MTTARNGEALTPALVQEFATAMGAMLGGIGAVAPSIAEVDAAWAVTVGIGDPARGAITIGLSQPDCERLVELVLGSTEPSSREITDLLQEIAGHAVGALRENPAGNGSLFCVEKPTSLTDQPEGKAVVFTFNLSSDFAPLVSVWSQFDDPSETATVAAAFPASHEAPRAPGKASKRPPAPAVPANLDVILDIDLPLSVRFGETDLTLDALTKLGPGSVIDLGRSPDDPVDVLVNGRLVARAEVVVVAGNYGVRILEVVSAADRVRSLGA